MSKGQLEGSQGPPKGSEGPLKGSEGILEGSEGLPEGPWGRPRGTEEAQGPSEGLGEDGRMYARMYRPAEFLPILRLRSLSRPLPKKGCIDGDTIWCHTLGYKTSSIHEVFRLIEPPHGILERLYIKII